MSRAIFTFLLALMSAALPARAHEFWIEPDRFQVAPDDSLFARFRNGENFDGITLAYFPNRSARFDVIFGGAEIAVTPRMGDSPALDLPAPGEGLAVIVHETAPSTVTYKTWAEFQAFADHKDFPGIAAAHDARALPRSDFVESYTRHAKALVAIGSGQGADAVTGMETELVALANPYTDDIAAGLPVRLLYQGQPRGDAQVEVFARDPSGAVVVTRLRTDASGVATIPVLPGHVYLLDAVVLRPAPEGGDAVWETLWASLTFAIP